MCPAAGSEVIRGTADGHLNPAGTVGAQEFFCHLGAKAPFPGVGVVGSVLGQWTSCRAPVHVDVLHAHQPGA